MRVTKTDSNTNLKESKKVSLKAMMHIAHTVRDLRSIPKDMLYADMVLIDRMPYQQFESTINMLKKVGTIREESFVIHWVTRKN